MQTIIDWRDPEKEKPTPEINIYILYGSNRVGVGYYSQKKDKWYVYESGYAVKAIPSGWSRHTDVRHNFTSVQK